VAVDELPANQGKTAFRMCHRIQFDSVAFADMLWHTGMDAVCQHLFRQRGVRLYENIRFYKYTKGHAFGPHYDEAIRFPTTGEETKWTLLVYLSECVGGETAFLDGKGKQPVAIAPRAGMALLHAQGPRCLLHEGREVRDGVKYVMRSDVVMKL